MPNVAPQVRATSLQFAEQFILRQDRNRDLQLARSEAKMLSPFAFDRIDLDRNGQISRNELAANADARLQDSDYADYDRGIREKGTAKKLFVASGVSAALGAAIWFASPELTLGGLVLAAILAGFGGLTSSGAGKLLRSVRGLGAADGE